MHYHQDEQHYLPIYHALNPGKAPAPVYKVYHGWKVRPGEDIVHDRADSQRVPPTSVVPWGVYYNFSLDDAIKHFHELHNFYIDVGNVVEDMWFEFDINLLNIKTKLESPGQFYKLYYSRDWDLGRHESEYDQQLHHTIRLSITRMNVCLPGDRRRYMFEMDYANRYPEGGHHPYSG